MNDDLALLVHGDHDTEISDVLRELFAEQLFAPAEGLDHTGHCRLTYRRMQRLNERMPAPSKLLADPQRLLSVFEGCAVVSPSLFLAVNLHTLCLGAVHELGAGRNDLGDYIDELDTMSSYGCLLITEAGRGNSHRGIRTEASHDPDTGEFVLHTPDPAASKVMAHAGLPGAPKLGVVFARLLVAGVDRGVFGFVLPIRDADGPRPGIRITPLPEAPFVPLDHAAITFDRVRLPARALMHDDARLTTSGQFHDPLDDPEERLRRSLSLRHWARVAASAALGAVIRTSAAMAIQFAHSRRTVSHDASEHDAPEQPVIQYRSQQLSLFDALATAYAMTSLINRVKRTWAQPLPCDDPSWTPGPGFNRTVGLVKALTGWTAERVASECGQRCGSHGIFTHNRFVSYLGLAHVLSPGAGDSYLAVLESAKAMAAGTAYQPPSPDLVEPARRNPSDPRVALELGKAREQDLHATLADGMHTADRRGQAPFEAWNNQSWLARELAEAHGFRLALESLVAAIPTVADPAMRAAVEHLATLFALRDLWRNSGWYLSAEMLTPQQIRSIPATLNTACERLLPHSEALAAALLPRGLDLTATTYEN
jgi:acyl-CoA oxidase